MDGRAQTTGDRLDLTASSGGLAFAPARVPERLAIADGVRAGRAGLAAKRGFDIAVSALALVLLGPLLLLIALAVVAETGRPVFYRQTRHGLDRATFRMWKFRTLSREASLQPFRQVTYGDARITRVGRFLRRTNLDELPQLLNVLAGSMSLVGPRPHPVELDARFEPLIAGYARRYAAKPGITGWAQVNGCRGETDTLEKMEARIGCDQHYLAHRSMWLDLRIIALTLLSAKSYRNAR